MAGDTLAQRVAESCGYPKCSKPTHALVRDLWWEVRRLQAHLDARAVDLGRVTQDTSHAIKRLEATITDLRVQLIVARNPGIDPDEVRATLPPWGTER